MRNPQGIVAESIRHMRVPEERGGVDYRPAFHLLLDHLKPDEFILLCIFSFRVMLHTKAFMRNHSLTFSKHKLNKTKKLDVTLDFLA